MSVNIKPHLFGTIIEKPAITGNIRIKPSIFATIIEHEPAKGNIKLKPFLFATIKTRDVFAGDTLRVIKGADKDKFVGDTLRIIEGPKLERFNGDTYRKLREKFSGDTYRKVVRTEKFEGDTIIRVPYNLQYLFEQPEKLQSKFAKSTIETFVDTLKDLGIVSLSLELNEKTLSDNISIESATHMNINEAIQGQLFNYKFDFLVEETSLTELVQSIQGMYNQDELLYTQFYLTNGAIAGLLSKAEKEKILDKLEHIIINNETARSYLDKATIFQIDNEEVTRQNFIDYYVAAHLPVSSFVKYIAQALGLKANVQMQDFRHKDLVGNIGSYITYADFLTQAFNWTSQIPQFQVNCFIRGDTLHVIMRGYEQEVYDITNLNHSRPTISKRLLRNLWSNAIESSDDEEDEDDNPQYFTGTLSDAGSSYSFVNGLLRSEYHEKTYSEDELNFTSKQNISFSYTAFNQNAGLPNNAPLTIKYTLPDKIEIENAAVDFDWYLMSKSEYSIGEQWNPFEPENNTKTIQNTKTEYSYGINIGDGVYLTNETTKATVYNYIHNARVGIGYELESIEEEVTETRHIPLGNGFYSTATYKNGVFMGSSISQGKPSQQVSQYTMQQVQSVFLNTVDLNQTDKEITDYDEKRKLAAIVNTSFPIVEEDVKNACIEAMYWLNRRIEESISIDIYSEVINGMPQIDHVVDFTERVKYEGNEYYLVSNHVNLTPTQYSQKLELIRWY